MTDTGRSADIRIAQLPNGYWMGKIIVRSPRLAVPVEDQCDTFHDAGEALTWADQRIREVVAHA